MLTREDNENRHAKGLYPPLFQRLSGRLRSPPTRSMWVPAPLTILIAKQEHFMVYNRRHPTEQYRVSLKLTSGALRTFFLSPGSKNSHPFWTLEEKITTFLQVRNKSRSLTTSVRRFYVSTSLPESMWSSGPCFLYLCLPRARAIPPPPYLFLLSSFSLEVFFDSSVVKVAESRLLRMCSCCHPTFVLCALFRSGLESPPLPPPFPPLDPPRTGISMHVARVF